MPGRVVVVNPSAELATMYAELLRHAGYQATASSDAASALKEIEAGQVDLVVTSFPAALPDGTPLVRRMRAQRRWARLPVLNLSPGRDPAEEHAAAVAGVDATLRLPVAPAHLLAVVRDMLLHPRSGSTQATPP